MAQILAAAPQVWGRGPVGGQPRRRRGSRARRSDWEYPGTSLNGVWW
ncbi:hypothetical protein [Alloactinosynnema sp. L-07]|nr:hypothetical protein [Alloactinosynnema sp. L-07]